MFDELEVFLSLKSYLAEYDLLKSLVDQLDNELSHLTDVDTSSVHLLQLPV